VDKLDQRTPEGEPPTRDEIFTPEYIARYAHDKCPHEDDELHPLEGYVCCADCGVVLDAFKPMTKAEYDKLRGLLPREPESEVDITNTNRLSEMLRTHRIMNW
jgi:hypothetical protein